MTKTDQVRQLMREGKTRKEVIAANIADKSIVYNVFLQEERRKENAKVKIKPPKPKAPFHVAVAVKPAEKPRSGSIKLVIGSPQEIAALLKDL